MHHLTDRITHTMAFVTPVVEHWLEWEIVQWVHHEWSIRPPIAPWTNALTTELHLAPQRCLGNWGSVFRIELCVCGCVHMQQFGNNTNLHKLVACRHCDFFVQLVCAFISGCDHWNRSLKMNVWPESRGLMQINVTQETLYAVVTLLLDTWSW